MDLWPNMASSKAVNTDHALLDEEVLSDSSLMNNYRSKDICSKDEDLTYFVEYGWENIGIFDDLDQIFRKDEPIFATVAPGNSDKIWSSSKYSMNSPPKSVSINADPPFMGSEILSRASENIGVKSNYRQQIYCVIVDLGMKVVLIGLICGAEVVPISYKWHYLACHPRLWLRVDRSMKCLSEPSVFPTIESAVSAARPGDTILIGAGGKHLASDIKIQKPLCPIGGGELPDVTTLVCSRGSDSALELFSTCKLANLTVRAELGSCLLHRSGRLIIDGCVLRCESNPLDYLSYPIVSTTDGGRVIPSSLPSNGNGVFLSRTRI